MNANLFDLPDRLLLPRRFDPDRLGADLQALHSTIWTDHFVRQNYVGSWSAIPLRAPVDASHPILMVCSHLSGVEYGDTPFLAQTPYLREVLRTLECPQMATRLMRLTPGSTIKEHRDPDLDPAGGFARLHIPILTNPGAKFWLNDRLVVMESGSLWYLRLTDPHRARNDGDADRVHLVIDVEVNDWLRSMLVAALRRRGRRRTIDLAHAGNLRASRSKQCSCSHS
jgi:hypothetical protein